MTGSEWDSPLWWAMLVTAAIAAGLSIATNVLDRRNPSLPTRRQRLLLHIASYGFMTISILAFVVRGLLAPE